MTEGTSKSKRRYARDPKTTTTTKPQAPTVKNAVPREGSKIARVITLLQSSAGATLGEMVEATGWLPHTTRAALTGLKKKGHAIDRSKRGDATCYRIAGEA